MSSVKKVNCEFSYVSDTERVFAKKYEDVLNYHNTITSFSEQHIPYIVEFVNEKRFFYVEPSESLTSSEINSILEKDVVYSRLNKFYNNPEAINSIIPYMNKWTYYFFKCMQIKELTTSVVENKMEFSVKFTTVYNNVFEKWLNDTKDKKALNEYTWLFYKAIRSFFCDFIYTRESFIKFIANSRTCAVGFLFNSFLGEIEKSFESKFNDCLKELMVSLDKHFNIVKNSIFIAE